MDWTTMKTLLILEAVIMAAIRINASHYFTTYINGNEYYIETDRSYTWLEALHECFKLNASLVTIESNSKQQEIEFMLENYLSDEDFIKSRLWTAGNDNVQEGDYNWITNGNGFTFTKWALNEPNNDGMNENCVEITAINSMWNDVPCSIQLGFICELSNHKCIKENLSELEELKESHEKYLKMLGQAHQLELKNKTDELDNLKKSQQEELNRIKQKNKDELEAVKKFHMQIMDDNKNAMNMLNQSHENATRLLLQQKDNEIVELKKANALELAKALESHEKLCDNKTTNLIQQNMQERFEQKLKELKGNYAETNLLKLMDLKNAHLDELKRLRETKEQELEALRGTCNKAAQKLTDEKNLEIASWQKISELQMNRSPSYKFYNFVFNGNNKT